MLLGALLDTQPTDIWHDPLFLGILGVVSTILAGLLGVGITYYVYRRQRRKKELTYQIVSDAPIADIDPSISSRVKLSLDGKPVENVSLVVLKLWNSGNAAVKREDYDEPVTFEFNGRAMVSSDIIETDPPEFRETLQQEFASISQTSEPNSTKLPKFFLNLVPIHRRQEQVLLLPKSINLPKFLFNPKRSITLSILLTGSWSKISAKGSIVDGELVIFDPEKQQTLKILPRIGRTFIIYIPFFISIICSISIFILFASISFSFPTFSRTYSTIIILAFILACVNIFGALLSIVLLFNQYLRTIKRRRNIYNNSNRSTS
jgi:hypothetical protein